MTSSVVIFEEGVSKLVACALNGADRLKRQRDNNTHVRAFAKFASPTSSVEESVAVLDRVFTRNMTPDTRTEEALAMLQAAVQRLEQHQP